MSVKIMVDVEDLETLIGAANDLEVQNLCRELRKQIARARATDARRPA